MRRALIAVALTLSIAHANGRPPITNGVVFREGDTSEIWIRTTFGLLVSRDSGCSFRWICEQNVGYGGTFDPRYLIARDGTIYAATFNGLRLSRDGGCTFVTSTEDLAPGTPGRIAGVWVDALDLGPLDEVWAATSEQSAVNDIYRSTDAALTFEARGPAPSMIQWKSLRVAPSDAQRVYATGYEIAGEPRAHFYRTSDAGTNWDVLPLTGFVFGEGPLLRLLAVDRTDADLLFLVTVGSNGPFADRVYRSSDGGMTVSEVLATESAVSDLVVDGSTVMIATKTAGYVSTDAGLTFQPAPASLQFGCIGQRSDGKIFACGANWMPDFQALGQSSDGLAWEKVFRFVEMEGPVECPTGTPQADTCGPMWPAMQQQFGTTGSTCLNPPELTPDTTSTPGSGCCDAGGSSSGLLLGAAVAMVCRRRRPSKDHDAKRAESHRDAA